MAPLLPPNTCAVPGSKPKSKTNSAKAGKTPIGQKHVTKTSNSRGEPTTSKPKPKDTPTTTVKKPSNLLRDPFITVDFEVHGHVQGVFFRKHTQQQAEKLGVRGWCKNTEQGTVLGQLQGNRSIIEPMKKWLKTVGSPKSSIEKCEFREEHEIDTITIDEFLIRR